MKSPRRRFLQGLAAAAASLGFSGGSRAAAKAGPASGETAGASGREKPFAVPALFSGTADLPEDVYGDLCLIRKGRPSMMTGGGATSVEPIATREEWVAKATALREIYQQMLGTAPPISEALSIRVESEKDRGEVIERRVTYLLGPGERVAALMLIPKGAKQPGPAVLTIHPTTALGKEQTVGRGDMADGQLTEAARRRAYGLHLAQRGYITFSPDLLGAGERMYPGRRSFDNQPFIDAHPHWSGTGKDLHDLRRALDVMESMPEIDASRIASLGHSQGAGLTCYLAAVDARIKVGVANCGVYPSRVRRNPFNQARTSWWTGIPALRPYMLSGKPLPIDVHELLALAAPRPFLNIIALNDAGFGVEDEPLTRPSWENLAYNVKKIYALYGAEERFENVMHLDGHDFHDAMREKAYAFVDRHLKGGG